MLRAALGASRPADLLVVVPHLVARGVAAGVAGDEDLAVAALGAVVLAASVIVVTDVQYQMTTNRGREQEV